jgi:hypothetical protein
MTIMGSPSLRFWIVDDDLAFGRSLEAVAERGIRRYFSRRSFLDSVPPGKPAAIVDIMPGDDGFDLLKMRAGTKCP